MAGGVARGAAVYVKKTALDLHGRQKIANLAGKIGAGGQHGESGDAGTDPAMMDAAHGVRVRGDQG